MPTEVPKIIIPAPFLKLVGLNEDVARKVFSALWYPSWYQQYAGYQEALAVATPYNLMVLAAFTGNSWCSHCQALKSEVFDTKTFGHWAFVNSVVLVDIGFPYPVSQAAPEDTALMQQYNVIGFPSVLGLNADGTERGRVVGYMSGTGPANWIQQFEVATGLNTVSTFHLVHAKVAA